METGPLEGPLPCSLSTTSPRLAMCMVVFGPGEALIAWPATFSPVNVASRILLVAPADVAVLDTPARIFVAVIKPDKILTFWSVASV